MNASNVTCSDVYAAEQYDRTMGYPTGTMVGTNGTGGAAGSALFLVDTSSASSSTLTSGNGSSRKTATNEEELESAVEKSRNTCNASSAFEIGQNATRSFNATNSSVIYNRTASSLDRRTNPSNGDNGSTGQPVQVNRTNNNNSNNDDDDNNIEAFNKKLELLTSTLRRNDEQTKKTSTNSVKTSNDKEGEIANLCDKFKRGTAFLFDSKRTDTDGPRIRFNPRAPLLRTSSQILSICPPQFVKSTNESPSITISSSSSSKSRSESLQSLYSRRRNSANDAQRRLNDNNIATISRTNDIVVKPSHRLNGTDKETEESITNLNNDIDNGNDQVVKIESTKEAKSTEKSIGQPPAELAEGNENSYSDEDEEKYQKLRRCSSLKTPSDSSNSPNRKKIVRFADALGLDLADVRTFMDEIPSVPKSAYDDLEEAELTDNNTTRHFYFGGRQQSRSAAGSGSDAVAARTKFLVPVFQRQPGEETDFLDKVRDNCVCLERLTVDCCHVCLITGVVRVRNLDFHKSVYVRYTLDNWTSFNEIQATYMPNSYDGFSDQFCFVIYLYQLELGQQLQLAVRFHCKGSQYWDNNKGANYVLLCLSKDTLPASSATQQQQRLQRERETPPYDCSSFPVSPQSNPNGSSFY